MNSPAPERGPALSPTTPEPGPFAPVSLRIHPLTHVSALPDGDSVIICHIEFKDRWHHAVKAAGPLEIQLYRPATSGLRTDLDRQELRWPLDLDDLERNADWYDPVTRTYRFQLDIPHGVEAPRDADDSPLRLRAVFAGRTAEGGQVILRDDYVIQH